MTEDFKPIHPGVVLQMEFLDEYKISAYRLAMEIGVHENYISAILAGQQVITAGIALRLGKYFNTSAEVWINLQTCYEMRLARIDIGNTLEGIKPITAVSR